MAVRGTNQEVPRKPDEDVTELGEGVTARPQMTHASVSVALFIQFWLLYKE